MTTKHDKNFFPWRIGKVKLLVLSYLFAAVASNLAVTSYGLIALYLTGFVLIPFDLVARDGLHEMWHHKHLKLKMAALVGSGSVLSCIANWGSLKVSVASFLSFAVAGTIDTVAYALLEGRPKLVKINGSNIFSSFADSATFITLVFGWSGRNVLTQSTIKFCGGFVWSLVLTGGFRS